MDITIASFDSISEVNMVSNIYINLNKYPYNRIDVLIANELSIEYMTSYFITFLCLVSWLSDL